MSASSPGRHTPLHEAHLALGAKMVPFAGWDMPLQYTGILDEHRAVRSGAGVFDVSHMGEVVFRGPRALAALERLMTNHVGRLRPGEALYTLLCNDAGGILDDCIVYRRGDEDYLVVVNAANAAADVAWMAERASDLCPPSDESDAWALLAVQGPEAAGIVARLAGAPLDATVPRFGLAQANLAGVPVLCARTGYTGEDGFEVFIPWHQAPPVWDAILAAGARPIGLGARDTLRLEARLPLHGQDIDPTTTPLEAALGWAVKPDAKDFIGKDALAAQKAAGIPRRLAGFVIEGRGIARHGYPIHAAGEPGAPASSPAIGQVTSGTTAPMLGKAVALGYVPTQHATPGATLYIDCRGKLAPAHVVKGPFWSRGRNEG